MVAICFNFQNKIACRFWTVLSLSIFIVFLKRAHQTDLNIHFQKSILKFGSKVNVTQYACSHQYWILAAAFEAGRCFFMRNAALSIYNNAELFLFFFFFFFNLHSYRINWFYPCYLNTYFLWFRKIINFTFKFKHTDFFRRLSISTH
jgi:hypothetical protein